MASVQSNTYEGRYLLLECWEESYSSAGNSSVVGWKLSSLGGVSNYYGISPITVVVNGVEVYSTGFTAWNSYQFPAAKGEISGTVTVPHNADGTKSISFSLTTYVYTTPTPLPTWTGTLALTNLGGGSDTGNAQASQITAASNGVLGQSCTVEWTPASRSYVYTVSCEVSREGNSVTEQITVYRPNTTGLFRGSFSLPYGLAKSIPNGTTRTVELKLTTYKSENRLETDIVGNPSTITITVTVPENENTRPQVTGASCIPSPDPFGGAYIQAQTGVKLTGVTASGLYGATIASTYIRVEGVNYSSGQASAAIAQYGEVTVQVYAVDSRGFTSAPFGVKLTVAPYSKPKLKPVEGQNRVTAQRCNNDGSANDRGAYIRISAQRQYSPVVLSGVQKNFCQIRYRYKEDTASAWGSWVVILAGDAAGDAVQTDPLIGTLLENASYQVEIQAVDTLGGQGSTVITVSSDKIFWHRDGARGSLGFGCMVDEDDVFLLAPEKILKVLGGLVLGGDAALALLDLAHPIGSILETVSAMDPNEELGGAWVQVAGTEESTKWRRTE